MTHLEALEALEASDSLDFSEASDLSDFITINQTTMMSLATHMMVSSLNEWLEIWLMASCDSLCKMASNKRKVRFNDIVAVHHIERVSDPTVLMLKQIRSMVSNMKHPMFAQLRYTIQAIVARNHHIFCRKYTFFLDEERVLIKACLRDLIAARNKIIQNNTPQPMEM